jgi:hypothetical protein
MLLMKHVTKSCACWHAATWVGIAMHHLLHTAAAAAAAAAAASRLHNSPGVVGVGQVVGQRCKHLHLVNVTRHHGVKASVRYVIVRVTLGQTCRLVGSQAGCGLEEQVAEVLVGKGSSRRAGVKAEALSLRVKI